jgi:uncharacterized protein YndB with AHSA1/START domain
MMGDMKTSSAIECQVYVQASPEMVYPFLVDPERMMRWMGSSVNLEPYPGGIYHIRINAGTSAHGKFVEVVPNQRVVFTFGWEGEDSPLPPGSTTVEIILEADQNGTLVRLRHLGLPEPAQAQHIEGWDHYLARLAKVASGGDPGLDPMESSEQMA